ncbi:MAG: response regulator [Hyphomicrobiaceae bacterium]
MATTTNKRIQIVDDDPADAKQLQSILTTSGYEVQVTSDCEAFLAALATLDATLVILDLRMPGMGGLEVLKRLASARSDIPVIMVSGRGDVRSAVKAIKAGAADFLEKPVDPEELVEVVKRVSGRQRGEAGVRPSAVVDVWSKVSPREAEVLERLLKGQRNKQVAHDMQIAERTVETHRANMMKRLGVTSFADLLRLAIASGERPRTT